jgi:hypothetical protein
VIKIAIPLEQVTKGIYRTDLGYIARVQVSRQGYPYAKLLNQDTKKFDYVKGLIYHLTERLNLDEALDISKRIGYCCCCGRTLTNSKSVDSGIGPICRGYF